VYWLNTNVLDTSSNSKITSSIPNCLNAKDFNLRIAPPRICKKFKKQNAHHVVFPSYLKMQVLYVHHAQKIKAMLTAIADAAADISESRYSG
jgi:hypothetical protein